MPATMRGTPISEHTTNKATPLKADRPFLRGVTNIHPYGLFSTAPISPQCISLAGCLYLTPCIAKTWCHLNGRSWRAQIQNCWSVSRRNHDGICEL